MAATSTQCSISFFFFVSVFFEQNCIFVFVYSSFSQVFSFCFRFCFFQFSIPISFWSLSKIVSSWPYLLLLANYQVLTWNREGHLIGFIGRVIQRTQYHLIAIYSFYGWTSQSLELSLTLTCAFSWVDFSNTHSSSLLCVCDSSFSYLKLGHRRKNEFIPDGGFPSNRSISSANHNMFGSVWTRRYLIAVVPTNFKVEETGPTGP
jgi:hypothetical protein